MFERRLTKRISNIKQDGQMFMRTGKLLGWANISSTDTMPLVHGLKNGLKNDMP